MSLSATGAHRPLQSRPKNINPFKSPFTNHPRRKPPSSTAGTKRSRKEADEEKDSDRLHYARTVNTLPPKHVPQDVVSLAHHIQTTMFAEIPERAAGMNSTRIAEVLNLRRNLPPIISVAHLHALSASTTATEREIAKLVAQGVVRKIGVLGRGKGGAPVGEGVVLMAEWRRIVRESSVEDELKEKYIGVLEARPSEPTVDASVFEADEAARLIRAGFLTSTSALASQESLLSRPGAFSLGAAPLSRAGSMAATGTLAAVGGSEAVHASGGGGGGIPTGRAKDRMVGQLTFSLPGTGTYLKLLTEARTHLLALLRQSSPKYKEATRNLLRERWDGGVPVDDAANRAKRARGEWVGVLPGRTKKWKTFNGMHFEWILEECLGSGAVECFDTGSVGLGVRAT